MKLIDFSEIAALKISPKDCFAWVKDAFLIKPKSLLPPKISTKQEGNVFFNTMPCLIPQIERFGVKEVSRFPNRVPALKSDLMLYDAKSGELLSVMDATWITAMRTGAVAALAVKTFRRKDAKIYSFVGLGNTARATLLCLLENTDTQERQTIRLLKYKGQEKLFAERFSGYGNVCFEFVDSMRELIVGADVVVSCVTAFDSPVAKDEWFKEGVLVVPVHTRGFQNCDLFFDKVFADDRGHVEGFKYFSKFKQFGELSDVLLGKIPGRESERERILAYNIGIALHDVYFASKIYERSRAEEHNLITKQEKFWV
ncbi:MAG: ornithine cyclodeaminase family protein [Verrucomicrobia bacterium]|nr:ornithine cyclodeaminase family protein [Verrucomicrobiota bacterium]